MLDEGVNFEELEKIAFILHQKIVVKPEVISMASVAVFDSFFYDPRLEVIILDCLIEGLDANNALIVNILNGEKSRFLLKELLARSLYNEVNQLSVGR